MSAIRDPPQVGMAVGTQGSPATSPETKTPSSPVALERPIPEPHAVYPSASRKPTPDDGENTRAGPSLTSTTAAPSGTTFNVPPDLAFLQSGTPPFALPFGAGSFEFFAQGFAGPSTQAGAANLASQASSALPHEYSFLPLQSPLAPQPSSSHTSTVQGVQGQDQFDMGGGQMFGLEPLGYNESMSFLSSVSESQVGTSSYAQPHDALTSGAPTLDSGDPVDTGMPDFALMDDTLMVWSNLPPGAE